MTEIEDTVEVKQPKQQELPLGPGERLRIAREQVGLSQDAVALRLRLSTRVVKAIDADNYEEMPAFAFVRGYLRAYSQLVSVPADEVIETFNAMGLVDSKKTDRPSLPYVPPKPVTASSRSMRWVTVGIVGVLLLLVGVWWSSQPRLNERSILPAQTVVAPAATDQQNNEVTAQAQTTETPAEPVADSQAATRAQLPSS